jgi:hypothetical protein
VVVLERGRVSGAWRVSRTVQEIRELATEFRRFVGNDFKHAIQDISYLKGQMKLVLLGLSALLVMMSAIMAGLVIEVLK